MELLHAGVYNVCVCVFVCECECLGWHLSLSVFVRRFDCLPFCCCAAHLCEHVCICVCTHACVRVCVCVRVSVVKQNRHSTGKSTQQQKLTSFLACICICVHACLCVCVLVLNVCVL